MNGILNCERRSLSNIALFTQMPALGLFFFVLFFLAVSNLANASPVRTDLTSGTYTCLGGTQNANINELNMNSANGEAKFLEVKVLNASLPRTTKLCYTAKNGSSYDSICNALGSAAISVYRGGVNIGTGAAAATNPFAVNDYLVLQLPNGTNEVNEVILIDTANKVLDYIQICTGACATGYWSTSPTSCGNQLPNVGSSVKDIARFPTDGTGAWTSNTLNPLLPATGTTGTTNSTATLIDHYELSLAASNVACMATTVTVTACSNASSPCISPATTINGQTATLATSAGALGVSSVIFNAAGIATTTLSYPAAADGALATVTLSAEQTAATNLRQCCQGGVCAVANSCAATFNTAGFIFSSTAGGVSITIPTQTAGTASGMYYLRAVKTNTATQACEAALTASGDVNLGYTCNNPNTCNASNLLDITPYNVATPQATQTVAPASTATTLFFDANGNAPFTFNYRDVGQITINASKAAGTPVSLLTALSGSSNAFVTKPGGFVLSGIQQTAAPNLANPAALNAAGNIFVRAGEPFTVTVAATTSSGATAPSYGKETTPESVKLTPSLVAGLGLSNNPALSGSFGAFANGVATGTAFTWDEVGIITLTPSVGDTDYLGAGDVTGTTSGNVGRFSLGKFVLQGVSFDERADLCQSGVLVSDGVTACASTFSYTGEQINARFTLVPNSLNGVDVLNYVDSATAANDFAKLDPTTFAGLNLGAVDRVSTGFPHYLTARVSNSGMPVATCATVPCFQSGTAAVTVPFMLSRSASAHVVYSAADIGIALADSDGARVEGPGATAGLCNNPNVSDCYDLNVDASAGNDRAQLGTTQFRHGRSHLDNAVGSELLALAMPIALEYWNGTRYVTSADDNLSLLTFTMGNYLGNLASGETILTVPVFAGGVGRVGLSAPGAGNSGSVDVTVTAPSYLPGETARGTFGVYKGNKAFIYRRESY